MSEPGDPMPAAELREDGDGRATEQLSASLRVEVLSPLRLDVVVLSASHRVVVVAP